MLRSLVPLRHSIRDSLRRRMAIGIAMAIGFPFTVGAAHAALEADFVTTRGTITVQLEYVKAPRAVANLITLSQGTRNWVDPRDGAVRAQPFYNGLSFHQVENEAASKLIGTGSPLGDGSDDPGYTFQDELDSSLSHTPYVMAMASDGPNTNGCRFYFTGNLGMPERDGGNVVFGSVPSTGSRAVIDAILAAGAGGTSISAVNIRKTDAAALAFNELDVSLPVVKPLGGALKVTPGVAAQLDYPRVASTLVRAHSSLNLTAWSPHYRSLVGLGDGIPSSLQNLDNADVPKRFYRFSLTEYPMAGGAGNFANRTITINSEETGPIVYQFDSTGMSGTFDNTPLPDFPLNFHGPFTVDTRIPPHYDGYSFRILLHVPALVNAPFNFVRGGIDVINTGSVSGRHVTTLYNAGMTAGFDAAGSLVLSRP